VLRRRGIDVAVREDVRQEILIWFLTTPREFVTVSRALVEKVVRQFLRPNNRRRYRLPFAASPSEEPASENDDGIARVVCLSTLRGTEQMLVSLILEGATWHEACERLRLPEGSHSYWRRRLQRRFSDNQQPSRPYSPMHLHQKVS
jgi:hypothetical protein